MTSSRRNYLAFIKLASIRIWLRAKEIRFDPDAWIVETEDRAGRHFLDLAKA
jgi:hypothetical protein